MIKINSNIPTPLSKSNAGNKIKFMFNLATLKLLLKAYKAPSWTYIRLCAAMCSSKA